MCKPVASRVTRVADKSAFALCECPRVCGVYMSFCVCLCALMLQSLISLTICRRSSPLITTTTLVPSHSICTAQGEVYVVSDCPLAAKHIVQTTGGTQARNLHPVELLAASYGLRPLSAGVGAGVA